jgi:DNA ligase-1
MLKTLFRILLVAMMAPCAVAATPAREAPPSILLAKVFDGRVDPSKYLVSEKFDGVRATWDGRALRFRSGNVVNAPAWFLQKLPPIPLDGELWLARGKFETLSGYVRKTDPVDEEWRQIKFLIFELPGAEGTFEFRAAGIRRVVEETNWPQLVAIEQFRVRDRNELKRRLDEVVKGGGEGLMLHVADAPYVTGRSDALLKLKPLDDTEAKVIAHVPGKGKYTGMLGALKVKTPEGKTFVIGTGFSEEVRRQPPPVGATITYTYRGLTATGLPRFASYLRIRENF